jgi:ATP-dependent DNA helicase RecG
VWILWSRDGRGLNELVLGDMTSVIVEELGTVLLRTKRMPIFEMTVGQGSGSVFE